METPVLNSHNKSEYEPAHSCEHLLNATMVKMFGCPRPRNAHVKNTSEIGTFKVISHSFENGVWRLRWKVINQ